MSECSNCANWTRIGNFQIGDCRATNASTAGGYVCPRHTPAGVAVVRERVAAAEFDVAKAAEKVMKANPRHVDIVSVQAALRCQYRQAAEVVGWLVKNGKVREADELEREE